MNSKDEELRPEYPTELIKSGARGRYAQRYHKEGANLALIKPDPHQLFPDSEAVNRALRDYAEHHKKSAI